MREECLMNGADLAFETVLSIAAKIDFIRRAKAVGYFIRLFFVATDDPRINAARIMNRYQEGGHIVPIDKISDRYYRSISWSLDAALLSDRAYFYDNTPEGQDPRLELKIKSGRLSKTYADQPHEWIQDLIDSLQRTISEDLAPE
jgi:predicted ABC-type ATPase